ncbi:putative uncharacterized protein C1orf196 [Sarcophilus harrisii]|uniref:putative uncharacterized protein C1orf196 n=1 Tax=Sarcophilus harrisii TaxID=9305 RepID=UPI001301DA05|nr:putative uncharacterized protein C1orf196 [Sarcophilus harrisii]
MSCECAGHSKGAQYSSMMTTTTAKDLEERAMDSMLVTSTPASGTFSHVFGQQCQLMEAAVQSLHTLNDQISHFVVTKSKTLEEDKDPFLPTEKESLKNSMALMRHLLMDAQACQRPETLQGVMIDCGSNGEVSGSRAAERLGTSPAAQENEGISTSSTSSENSPSSPSSQELEYAVER